MNRRELIKSGALTAAVVAISGTAISCGTKLTTWVATITGALNELKPILPAQASLITRIIAVATDFDTAYRAGKFASAVTIFENLSTLIDQLIADVGVMASSQVKVILAVVGVALRTIAVLLRDQASQPAVAAAVSAAGDSSAISAVKRLSATSEIDALFAAIKH